MNTEKISKALITISIIAVVILLAVAGHAQTTPTAGGVIHNADGSTTLVVCTYGGCSTSNRSSDYQFAIGKATSKDGQKWCDKWAGPGSWSVKHAEKNSAARDNIKACQEAGRLEAR